MTDRPALFCYIKSTLHRGNLSEAAVQVALQLGKVHPLQSVPECVEPTCLSKWACLQKRYSCAARTPRVVHASLDHPFHEFTQHCIANAALKHVAFLLKARPERLTRPSSAHARCLHLHRGRSRNWACPSPPSCKCSDCSPRSGCHISSATPSAGRASL